MGVVRVLALTSLSMESDAAVSMTLRHVSRPGLLGCALKTPACTAAHLPWRQLCWCS